MRVALVTEYYYPSPGGITEHVFHLGKHLKARGHDVTIVTSWCGGKNGVPPDLPVEYVGRSWPIFSNGSVARCTVDLRAPARLRKILAPGRFDILHVHSPLVPTLPLMAVLEAKCACVGTFHTHFRGSSLMRLFHPYLKRVAERLDGAVAVSPNAARSIRRYFDIECRIIPNGVDVAWFSQGRPIARFNDGIPNVLFVGRLDPRNRLELLLDAFVRVRNRMRARLVIVGDGPARRSYEAMVPPSLREDVCFEGTVLRRQPDYYGSAHVFCFTASIASTPMTVIEAMAAGRPVVSFSVDGLDRVLQDGEEGLVVPDGDAASMASAIERVLTDEVLAQRLGRKARARAVKDFSWDRLVVEVEKYYTELLEQL